MLDAAGIPEPAFVNGTQQTPLQGQSMVPSFDDAGAPEFRETQYFEMFGNRGIYHQGWTACTKHGTPWVAFQELPQLDDDVWELYSPDDWTQAHNLAKEMPEKLHELQRLFLIEAVRYNVLPIDDRKMVKFNAEIAGRPELIRGNTQMLYSGMRGLGENLVLNVKNKSHAITAQVVVPKDGAKGVVLAQGGLFGGWSLYTKDGRPTYCYNLLGLQKFKIEGDRRRSRPASTRCGWSSPTTEAAWARAAPSPSTSTARRAARDASSGRSRSSSPWTTRPTSAATAAHRSAMTTRLPTPPSTGRSNGSSSISARTRKTPTT